MPGSQVRLVGDWNRATVIMRKYRTGLVLQSAFKRAVAQEAQVFRREVISGVRKQAPGGKAFLPLHPLTIAKKRSSKALIDTGALFKSIAVHKIDDYSYFVGVHRTARSSGGKPLANIAELHENGGRITMRITQAMFHWFRSFVRNYARNPKSWGVGGGGARPAFRPGATLVIVIPARPFMGPVFEKMYGPGGREAGAAIMARVAILCGGDLGMLTSFRRLTQSGGGGSLGAVTGQ